MKTLMLALALTLPWYQTAIPCPQCYCCYSNWRKCSVFCYTRNTEGKTEVPRPMTKGEKKTCVDMCMRGGKQ